VVCEMVLTEQALGVLAYELICGEEPFAADQSQGTRRELFGDKVGARGLQRGRLRSK
jgi:hypothetical protein